MHENSNLSQYLGGMAISKDFKWKVGSLIPQAKQSVFSTEKDCITYQMSCGILIVIWPKLRDLTQKLILINSIRKSSGQCSIIS